MKAVAGPSGCGGFESFFFLKVRPEGSGFDGISSEARRRRSRRVLHCEYQRTCVPLKPRT